MRITRLSMKDFLSYKEGEIDFRELHHAAIVGKNGSGKSTISAAISWALFGNKMHGDIDAVVRDGAKAAAVTLDVEDREGNCWRIERIRNRGKDGSIRVGELKPDGSVSMHGDHTNKVAQEHIDKIVGISEDAWMSLAVMDQSSTAGGTRFTSASADTRRQILLSLLPDMEAWSKRESVVKAMWSDAKRQEQELSGAMQSLEDQASYLDDGNGGGHIPSLIAKIERLEKTPFDEQLSELSEKMDDLRDQRRASRQGSAISKMEKELRDLENKYAATKGELTAERSDIRSEWREISDRIESRQKIISEGRAMAKEASESSSEASGVDVQLRDSEAEKQDLQEELARVRQEISQAAAEGKSRAAQISKLEKQIEQLKASTEPHCVLCEQALSSETKSRVIEKSMSERDDLERANDEARDEFSELKARKEDTERDLADLQGKVTSMHKNLSRLREVESRAREREAELLGQLKKLPSSAKEDKVRREELASKGREIDTLLREAKASYDADVEDIEDRMERCETDSEEHAILSSMSKVQAEIDKVSGERDELVQARGALKGRRETLRDTQEMIDDKKEAIAACKKKVQALDALRNASSPKGVPSMMLDALLSELETAQNEILQKLPGSEGMSVEFRQDRKNKTTSGTKSVLDIIVTTPEGVSRPLESFSFGQRVRINLANLFALIRVVNDRYPGTITSIFLDEPLGPLDQETVPAFVDVLHSALAENLVEQILVVSHDQRVVEALPQRVTISRSDAEGSTIGVSA